MIKNPTYEELDQSLKELDRIFNFSTDMIGSGNLDGYFTKINSSFKHILGYTEEEILRKPFVLFVHDEDVKKTTKALADASEGKKDSYIQNRYKCKNGSYKWIEWKVLAIVQENKFFAVGRDITDRKKTEEAPRESEKRLRHISDTTFEGIVSHDHGKIIYANDQYYKMFGYTKEELRGIDAMSLTVSPNSINKMKKMISSGNLGPYEVIGVTKSGERFPIEIHAKVSEYHGQKIRMAAIIDMTRFTFDRSKFDCVSLDYMLPGDINGLDVYNHIREKDPNLDHLSKPVNNLDYVNKIIELIESKI